MAYLWAEISEPPPIYLFDVRQSKEAQKYADNLGQSIYLVPSYYLEGQHQSGLVVAHMIDRLRKRCENFKNTINCQRMVLLRRSDYYILPIKLRTYRNYLDPQKTQLLTVYKGQDLEMPEITNVLKAWL